MNKGKGFIEEFKKFIMRGNVMDMAVGVIVGGAFTSIVTSLNQDILTPVLGIFGGTDFSNLKKHRQNLRPKYVHIVEVRLQRKQPVALTVLPIWNRAKDCRKRTLQSFLCHKMSKMHKYIAVLNTYNI